MGYSTGGQTMNWLSSLQSRWANVSAREQRFLFVATALAGFTVVWLTAIAPALKVLKTAPAQHQALDAQWQHMRQLQAQVKDLQVKPSLTLDEARQAVALSLQPLGAAAQFAHQVDRSTVTFKGIGGDALARWLSTVRQNVHSTPTEAHLTRNPQGTWDGSVVLVLGGRS